MWNNVPSDWYQYEYTCQRCGSRYHASESGCSACEELSDEELEEIKEQREEYELSSKILDNYGHSFWT
jgi:transcription initiation factor IIE alpha subunit